MREDGQPLRVSGWKEWTPEDIKIQNYCDMRRDFQFAVAELDRQIAQLKREIARQAAEIQKLNGQFA